MQQEWSSGKTIPETPCRVCAVIVTSHANVVCTVLLTPSTLHGTCHVCLVITSQLNVVCTVFPKPSTLHGTCRLHSAASCRGRRQRGDCEQPAAHRSRSARHRQHAQAHHATACCCQAWPCGAAACAHAGRLQSTGNHLRRQVSVSTVLCVLWTRSEPFMLGNCSVPFMLWPCLHLFVLWTDSDPVMLWTRSYPFMLWLVAHRS